MPQHIPADELTYLRGLARRQAEIAALPVMDKRRKIWTDMNDCVPGARPPFVMESGTFDRDFMPDSMLRCASEQGGWLERMFLRNIRHHEILGDDHVCPDSIDIGWHIWHDEFGVEIKTSYADDSEGHTLGYHFDCPIKDLNDGIGDVKPASFGINRESTMESKAYLEEAFGDIMPVRLRYDWLGGCLTQRLMRLMPQDAFFVAMYECPDKLHALLSMLRDNSVRMMRWAEAEGLLTVNNGNQNTCGTCYNFTTKLPRRQPPPAPGKVKLSDMWGTLDSQETVGVSPDLFHEFCFPYYADIASMLGFVYWGCCEPVDPIWEKSLSHLPNLRAVSVSRWANQEFVAEALSGRDIVFSRKPDPNIFALYKDLDEAVWRKELRTTLEITTKRNIPFGFIVRDLYTLKGNLPKARRATEIAHEEIARFFG